MKAFFCGRKFRKLVCSCGKEYCHCMPEPVVSPAEADIPVRLVPSATPEHSHLYIDRGISFDKYLAVLKAMAEAGLVEWGFYDCTVERGYASVRVPWKPKGQVL